MLPGLEAPVAAAAAEKNTLFRKKNGLSDADIDELPIVLPPFLPELRGDPEAGESKLGRSRPLPIPAPMGGLVAPGMLSSVTMMSVFIPVAAMKWEKKENKFFSCVYTIMFHLRE